MADLFNNPKNIGKTYYLHGSAILLTENYLSTFGLLFDETFLYYEENILAIIFEKADLEMLYVPTLELYHKEDKSSALSFNNKDLIRRKFLLQSIFSSFKLRFSTLEQLKKILNRKELI